MFKLPNIDRSVFFSYVFLENSVAVIRSIVRFVKPR